MSRLCLLFAVAVVELAALSTAAASPRVKAHLPSRAIIVPPKAGVAESKTGSQAGESSTVSPLSSLSGTETFRLIVDFSSVHGLRPGSPVLVEGNVVGRVKKISSKMPPRNPRQKTRSFEVALDLDASISERLALGTCALQALPMTDARKTKNPVVELFVPVDLKAQAPERLAMLRAGDRIPGFSSYEEFWRSGAGDAHSSKNSSRRSSSQKAG